MLILALLFVVILIVSGLEKLDERKERKEENAECKYTGRKRERNCKPERAGRVLQQRHI